MSESIDGALPIGTLIDSGKRTYRIEQILGAGGFGITYKVSTELMVENVPVVTYFALKELFVRNFCQRENGQVISSSYNTAEIENCRESFLSEAKRLSQLSNTHENIVRVNESFSANGTSYYVMEFLDGPSLRGLIKQNGNEPLGWEKTVRLMAPIADALTSLHADKINHLDIKPDNIILDTRKTNRPVLIDFGLSKHYDRDNRPTSIIRLTGYSAGYSPMEQYVGLSSFSPAADVYAFAATMLFLLTGKDPLVATNMNDAFVRESLLGKAPDYAVGGFIKALQVLPEKRTSSISEFMNSIIAPSNSVSNEDSATVFVPPTTPQEFLEAVPPNNATVRVADVHAPSLEPPKPNSKSRLPMVFLIVGLVVAVALGAYYIYYSSNTVPVDQELVLRDQMSQEEIAPVEYYNPDDYYTKAEQYIFSNTGVYKKGYSCYFFKGDFSYKGKSYPIMLAFITLDGNIEKVVYRNLDYNSKIDMKYSSSGNSITLSGKDGGKDFTITLSPTTGNLLTGTADNQQFTMPVRLEPTLDEFDF